MQTGGLLKDLTVKETVQYTASLFAQSKPATEVLDRAGITQIADHRDGRRGAAQLVGVDPQGR